MSEETIIIPSSINDRKELLGVIKEVANSMLRAKAEREFQSEALKEASKKFNIKSKFLRTAAKDYNEQNIKTRVNETVEYVEFYNLIVENKNSSQMNDEEE